MSIKNEYQQHNFLSNTGFGTVSPTEKVDVTGNVNLSTGSAFKINGTNVLSGNSLGSGVTGSSLTSVGTLDSLTVSGNLTVDTNTLFVDSTNNRVGIGSATPGYTLDVAGNIRSTGFGRFGYLFGTNGAVTIDGTATTGTIQAINSSGVVAPLIINSSGGNVGIGTTTPTTALDVNGAVKSNNTSVAWVSFDGIPVTPTIQASYNVTSVSKTATGRYTITFTNALSNTNYAIVASGNDGNSGRFVTAPFTSKTTTSFNIGTGTFASDDDFSNVGIVVYNN